MDRPFIDGLIADLSTLADRIDPNSGGIAGSADHVEIAIDRAAWLAGLLALSGDVISVLDLQGKMLYVSRTMPSTYPSAMIGRDSADFVPDTHRGVWRAAIARAAATGEPQQVEIHSVGDYWWDTRLAPIRNRDSRIEYLLSIGSDITARKRAEAALALKDHQLQLALDASGMGQWRWDIQLDHLTWDSAAKRLFECEAGPDNITFGAFQDFVHADDRARVAEHVAHALRSGEYPDLEYRIALPSGTERWLLTKGKVLKTVEGNPTAFLGGILDITWSKRKEASLQRAHKLEAIGQLAGGVAHDFNNLLVVIAGNIELARRQSEPGLHDSLLADALNASMRAADLTRQLLAFGRRQPIHETPLDLNAVLQDTMKLLRRLIPESIEVEHIGPSTLPRFLGDLGQIEQVIINLCVNARDAMPSGGRLLLKTEVAVVNGPFRDAHPWARAGRYVLLSVTDTGHGMTPETIDRVFEPFFTTKDQGTGLGLATAYGIVKKHGGVLQAHNDVGRGSTFTVYLPVIDRDGDEVGAKIEAPIPRGHETILLGEDEELVRAVVRRILEQSGYRVLVAANGEEAVRMFTKNQEQVDLVLLDAIMPRKSGTQALLEIRALRPGVPIVMSSGYSDALAFGLEADVAFLQKPYEPDALLRIVRQALNKRS